VPVNPNTALQTARREVLASLSANWRFLTLEQQTSWNNVALEISSSDALGVNYNPTGHQVYVGNNLMRIIAGDPQVDLAPALDAPTIITSLTPTLEHTIAGITVFTVELLPDPFDAGQQVAIYASPASSSGKAFFGRSDLRLLTIAEAVNSPFNIQPTYTAKYGTAVTEGQRIMVAAVPISPNFYRGTEFRALYQVPEITP
jgi:hypothetical protein